MKNTPIFFTVLPVNPEFLSDQKSNQENDQVSDPVSAQKSAQVSTQEIKKEKNELKILEFCWQAKSRTKILEHLPGITNQFKNYQNHIETLIEKN